MSAGLNHAGTLTIAGGHLLDLHNGVDRIADVHVAGGLILAIGAPPDGFCADRTLDANGCVVAPGLVDLAVRLREPGNEHKGSLRAELLAAVAGGVTSVACPPDTDPPLDEPGLVDMMRYRAQQAGLARVHPVGALTARLGGERLTEMAELSAAGCVAFSQADAAVVDTQVLYRAMQYAATFGYRVWLRPQDAWLSRNGVAHEGVVATRLGLPAIPAAAETIDLDRILRLARMTAARVHLCRVSTAEAVAMIRAARAEGLTITADVSAAHLHLSDEDIGHFNPMMHLAPPLRSVADRDALRAGLADGTIDALCSDHRPLDDDEKQLPFGEALPGASGVELLLGLALRWGGESGLSLGQVLARLTTGPARVLGMNLGQIAAALPADLCVFDPHATMQITLAGLHSQGKNSPFIGQTLPGRVRATIVGGQVVYGA